MLPRKPRVCVLKAKGINCDEETAYAFSIAGADAQVVHINELRYGRVALRDFDIVVIPGGFSNGDDVAAGKILAIDLMAFLKDELLALIERGGLILGICNGFQVIEQAGLFALGKPRERVLTMNASGHFEHRWVRMRVEKTACPFTSAFEPGSIITLPVANGEGKYWASDEVLGQLNSSGGVVFRYVDDEGLATRHYPENPNDSLSAIAGVYDPITTQIFALMPHPERFVTKTQHPNWRRAAIEPFGLKIFESAVKYAASL